MRLYVDTNVFLDYLLERRSKTGRNLENLAWKFFMKAKQNGAIIVSTWTLRELDKQINPEKTNFLFSFLRPNLEDVSHDEKDKEKARLLSKENYDDALHIILARKSKADKIVTRNISDFKSIDSFPEAVLPEKVFLRQSF